MLTAHGIQLLADVRRFPASRRHPHFNRENLADSLAQVGIDYRWFEDLGGRREPQPPDQSVNSGWRNKAFRAYADYLQTPEFQSTLHELESLAGRFTVAIMCAEALEWQCHRRIISDALVVRGWSVRHIHGNDVAKTTTHELTEFAQVESGWLTYPAAGDSLFGQSSSDPGG